MGNLYFDKPATQWDEGTPLGNGLLGAMVLGKTDKEIIHMNEDSLYSGPFIDRVNKSSSVEKINKIRNLLMEERPKEAEKYAEKYLYSKSPHPRNYEPLGQIWLEFEENSEPVNYYKNLDMSKGILNIEYEQSEVIYKREMFISYPDNVYASKFTANEDNKLTFDIYLTRRDTRGGKSTSRLNDVQYNNGSGYLIGYNGTQEKGISFAMGIKIVNEGGEIETTSSRISIKNANSVVIYSVGRTNYRAENPLTWIQEQLKLVTEKGFEKIKNDHINDFSSLFNHTTLKLSDDSLDDNEKLPIPERLHKIKKGHQDIDMIETYFNFGKYLLISSSRKGSLPANLQGIWNKEFDASWGSRYTININIQMNYWMAEKMGLGELHLPLLKHLKIMSKRGEKVAKHLYGVRGSVTHHNTDIWGDSAPADFYKPATVWPFGGVWLALHLFEHYEYNRSREFFEQYFDVIENNILFLIDYLFADEKGIYNTGPSVSPENTYITSDGEIGTLCISPTMDIQIVREFFKKYLAIIDELDIEKYREESIDILRNLPETKVGQHGQIMEWQKDYEEAEPGHRHISQLFGLYPGTQIKYGETDHLIEAAKKTLERRLNFGGGHTGWSIAWIINFYARLQDKSKVYTSIKKLFADSTLDSLLDNHPPFQIDGNFGGANGILEMLVQDFDKEVILLPALPLEIPKGELRNIYLKSGVQMSIEWRKNKLVNVEIYAKRDTEFIIKYLNETVEVCIKKGERKNIKFQEKKGYSYEKK